MGVMEALGELGHDPRGRLVVAHPTPEGQRGLPCLRAGRHRAERLVAGRTGQPASARSLALPGPPDTGSRSPSRASASCGRPGSAGAWLVPEPGLPEMLGRRRGSPRRSRACRPRGCRPPGPRGPRRSARCWCAATGPGSGARSPRWRRSSGPPRDRPGRAARRGRRWRRPRAPVDGGGGSRRAPGPRRRAAAIDPGSASSHATCG